MSQQPAAHNTACADEGHAQHLCFLMYEGFHLNNREAYREMVRNAEYRCLYCSRTAAKAEHLCKPEAI